MLFKIGVLKTFANFTGEHLCWSSFNQALSKIFKNTFFHRTPPMTDSELPRPLSLKKLKYQLKGCLRKEYIKHSLQELLPYWSNNQMIHSPNFVKIHCIRSCV